MRRRLQRLAYTIERWPHFPPPDDRGSLTVFDVGLADSVAAHVEMVGRWARTMWETWSPHHDAVSELVSLRLALD